MLFLAQEKDEFTQKPYEKNQYGCTQEKTQDKCYQKKQRVSQGPKHCKHPYEYQKYKAYKKFFHLICSHISIKRTITIVGIIENISFLTQKGFNDK